MSPGLASDGGLDLFKGSGILTAILKPMGPNGAFESMDDPKTTADGTSEKSGRERSAGRKVEWAERKTPDIPPSQDEAQPAPGADGQGDGAADPNVIWARAMTDLVDRLNARTESVVEALTRKNPELEAIDRRLTDLDKRLAGLTESPRPTSKAGDKGWTAGLAETLKRLGRRVRGRGEALEAPARTTPAAPSEPPLVPFHKEIGDKAVLGITAFGLSDEQLVKVLDTVEADCARRGAVPVFLTDNDSFELFRARGMVFEYLPPPELREKFAPDLPWTLYLQRRYALFQRKWRPSGIISFGRRLPADGEEEGRGAAGPPVPPPEPPGR